VLRDVERFVSIRRMKNDPASSDDAERELHSFLSGHVRFAP
jgi:hypothetical protein